MLLEKKNIVFYENNDEIMAGYTLRNGGVSEKNYSSLNLGLHTLDSKEKVIKNRLILSNILKIKPESFVFANQTHSTNVKIIDKKIPKSFYDLNKSIKNCDGLITNKKNILLNIMTADCAAILLYDIEHKVVANLHSGWAGTINNIFHNCIEKLKKNYKTKIENLKIWISPCICSECYEIQDDFIEKIPSDYKSFIIIKKIKRFDIINAIMYNIKKEKIKETQVHIEKKCTLHNSDELFSYRKNKKTGRFVSFIILK